MLTRLVGIACYAVLGFLILAFIFSNRHPVELELFPLAATAEMPLYIALSMVFAIGLLVGLLHSFLLWVRLKAQLRRANRSITQLERDIAARDTQKAPGA